MSRRDNRLGCRECGVGVTAGVRGVRRQVDAGHCYGIGVGVRDREDDVAGAARVQLVGGRRTGHYGDGEILNGGGLALGGGSRVEVDDPTGRGVGASADECDTENRRDGVSRRVTSDGPGAPYDRASPMGNATARSGRASESWRGRRVVTQ